MFYSEEFKAKCKKIYPDSEKLHELLDTGDENVGRFLQDSIPKGITYSEILTANSLEELKDKALTAMEKMEVFAEWYAIFEEENKETE